MDVPEQSVSTEQKILDLLERFYTDLLLVGRHSEETAGTYKISVAYLLQWCVKKRIKLSALTVQNLFYYGA